MSDRFEGLPQGAFAKRFYRNWPKGESTHLCVAFPDGWTFDTEDSPEEISRLMEGSSDAFKQHDFFVAFHASMVELAKTQAENFRALYNTPETFPWEWFDDQVGKIIEGTFFPESQAELRDVSAV